MTIVSNANTRRELHQVHLATYQQQQTQAYELAQQLHNLYINKDVKVNLFGETLNGLSTADLLTKVQQTATRNDGTALSIDDIVTTVKEVADSQDITTAVVDAGQLVKNKVSVADAFAKADKSTPAASEATDVVLYGFGRIGRILTRLLLEEAATDKGLQLKAFVVRPGKEGDLAKRASLLERDSVHGTFAGSVVVDEANQGLIVNGRFVQVIYANDPSEIDYTSYGINDAIVIDNTGIWKDEAGLGKHLQAKGVKKVLLTAPSKGDIKNVVYGVNNNTIGDDTIVSAASCTTNAITPSLKVLNDEYGIVNGHVETIHAFTNDQNLIDNYHKADRRGRSAVLNMVITSTGAAKAVGKALPELNGKLTGNAIRVPTPNVSMAILNLNLEKAPESAEALNAFFKQVSQSDAWQSQIAYTDSTEAVSSDFVGTKQVGIVDAQATIVTDNHATVYIWYDNEVGYSTQVLRVAAQMAGVHYTNISA
ncbi:glyceraldehyde-3-phosphate dehydrogenase [Psychrobacter sp. YP14]|jgi:glyceraldehyde 3-phosphate dehydrogenase|uniref:Glyceraldehyde-3-phosphate dehydrogenase n=2 Tax=Psychrobacter TaxID=497 RepID=A5WFV2_PSYWF|nr:MULTISPECIES: glyceraldehyde-3-phosphate dehydrogenase [unclassified Psychrobacter]AWT50211.1 glyceraldehyde-3-phosphate dehydrogenase [Psychrobacter sp. YP14]